MGLGEPEQRDEADVADHWDEREQKRHPTLGFEEQDR
jgi:hypothetical protein